MASVPNPVSTHFRRNARVYLRSRNGVVRPCEQHIKDAILEGVATKFSGVLPVLKGGSSSAHRTNASLLTCDFSNMTLLDGETRTKEDIIVDVPWSSVVLSYIAFQGNDRAVRQQILVMALQRIKSMPRLKKILAAKLVPTGQIWENPHLRPGHPPFDNFVNSLLDFFQTTHNANARILFALFLEMADDENVPAPPYNPLAGLALGGIQFVFHGTNHEVMDGILLTGLDPRLRIAPGGDYFGVEFSFSLAYSRYKTPCRNGPLQLLFFMIIQPGLNGSAVSIVSDTKFELPLAKFAVEGWSF